MSSLFREDFHPAKTSTKRSSRTSLRSFMMTRKSSPPVATDAPVTSGLKRHPEEEYSEPRRKGLHKRKARKSVGAPQDTGTPDRSLKDTKAPQPNPQDESLAFTICALISLLLIMYVVNNSRPPPFTEPCKPCPSASSLKRNHGPTAIPTSLSQNTSSPSSLAGSYTTPTASNYLMDYALSPQNRSLISSASSACACLTVTVSLVCNNA